jgi:hypothetical protein
MRGGKKLQIFRWFQIFKNKNLLYLDDKLPQIGVVTKFLFTRRDYAYSQGFFPL